MNREIIEARRLRAPPFPFFFSREMCSATELVRDQREAVGGEGQRRRGGMFW